MTIPPFVLAWANCPGPTRVLAEVRSRLESGRLGARAKLRVGLDSAERAEVGRLLGALWEHSSSPVSIPELRAALRAHSTELDALVEAVGGPLRDLRAEREAESNARAQDYERAKTLLQIDAASPRALQVAERILASATSRSARAEEVLGIVAAGQSAAPIRLGVLAARLYGGDAHALDRSQELGRAVARYLSLLQHGAEEWTDPLKEAGGWAGAWAGIGVLCDGVSSQVLALNLPLSGDAAAVSLASAAPGEPVWLSLRNLDGQLAVGPGVEDIYVCENPVVLEEAADRYGAESKPLVCTFGVPTMAVYRLLDSLDARLHVRADGDATGWNIVEALLTRYPHAQRWRMPEGTSLYEEEVLDELMADLRPVGYAGDPTALIDSEDSP